MTRPFVCPAGRGGAIGAHEPCWRSLATSSVGVAAEIKQKLNLVDLIGEAVQLRKAGASFKGLCPFHNEKTPSFTVTPARETWKCFGCGRGGDIFNFVMERDSIDFPEALRRLAGRAGVEISERTTREDARRKRLRDALDSAIAFYHRVLTESHHGQPALDHLRGRGFTDATISGHLLGCSVDAWDTLSKALIEKRGFKEDELEAAGLVTRRQGRRGTYDRFRGRIIFPIRDASGNATGLGGRIIGSQQKEANGRDGGPKYLNSPATLLFDKSRTLYLIDRAKQAIRKEGIAVLVEGNTDALMAHQQGFENVVGTLGTALTPAQIELVTRYAPRIALAYDVDAAGQGAATFGATELSALVGEIERSAHKGRLTDVGVIRLPDNRDPDEVMRDDPGAWRKATAEPLPIVEYLIDHFAKRHDPRTLSGRDKLVAAVMPTIRRVTNPTQRDGYLQLLARRSGVDERVLLEELRRPDQVAKVVGRPAEAHVGSKINLEAVLSSPDALDPQAVASLLKRAEFSLLRLVLLRPYLRDHVEEPTAIEFASTPAREIWRRLQDLPVAGFDRAAFAESLDPTLAGVVRTMYADPEPLPEDEIALNQALEQSLLTLRRNRLDEEIGAKEFDIREAEAEGDRPTAEALLRDVSDLKQRRLDLDRQRDTTTVLTQRRQRATAASAASGGNG
ncbi:MAG TPA: DNA primase [Candidatus Limnocylindria bacterium]|nr:DNA primase [Candidatus Limnocylindria bacterium]